MMLILITCCICCRHLYDDTCMMTPVWWHLYDDTCMTTPVWWHLYDETDVTDLIDVAVLQRVSGINSVSGFMENINYIRIVRLGSLLYLLMPWRRGPTVHLQVRYWPMVWISVIFTSAGIQPRHENVLEMLCFYWGNYSLLDNWETCKI